MFNFVSLVFVEDDSLTLYVVYGKLDVPDTSDSVNQVNPGITPEKPRVAS